MQASCSGCLDGSSFLLVQPTAFSPTAGGLRAELSSQSPQCRRIFSITHPAFSIQRPLLMAGGAETAPPERKGHKKLLPALWAAHPGEAVLEIAAFQELAHHRADDRPPEAITLLIAFWIRRLKLRIACKLLLLMSFS
jgi:hypothetical protein